MFWNKFVKLCAEREKSPTAVVLELGLARSTVTNWKRGAVPNNVTVIKVANYFNVSPDYLIGDGDSLTIQGNTITGGNNAIGENNSIMVNDATEKEASQFLTSQEKELIGYFRELTEIERAKAFLYIAELGEKERE